MLGIASNLDATTYHEAPGGPVEGTMSALMGGVRSAMIYIGAVRFKEVPKRITFIMVGSQLSTVFGRRTGPARPG